MEFASIPLPPDLGHGGNAPPPGPEPSGDCFGYGTDPAPANIEHFGDAGTGPADTVTAGTPDLPGVEVPGTPALPGISHGY